MRDDHFNLCLEIATLSLFFLGLLFVFAAAVLSFTIVGAEFTATELSVSEEAWFQPRSYLISYLILAIPVVTMILVGLGIRYLFLRPESIANDPDVGAEARWMKTR